MGDSNITTISIPKVLSEKLKEKMEGTGFNSVSSYVTYILRQVLSNPNIPTDGKEKEAFTQEEEEKVKERLRSLGYLD
jgi:Arc/MetJ-type ribon-helix-helix transcriptional regulator